jgi:hypothetical protein
MTVNSTPVSGTYDIEFVLGGMFFTDIYYGETPLLLDLTVLSGATNDFSTIQFQKGATFDLGSVLIGGHSPSGTLQTFDLSTRTVIDLHTVPELESDNIEDFS